MWPSKGASLFAWQVVEAVRLALECFIVVVLWKLQIGRTNNADQAQAFRMRPLLVALKTKGAFRPPSLGVANRQTELPRKLR